MSERPTVTIIQSRDGQVRRVRIDDRELAVQHAGPVLMGGKMAVTMTVIDAVIETEMEPEPVAGA